MRVFWAVVLALLQVGVSAAGGETMFGLIWGMSPADVEQAGVSMTKEREDRNLAVYGGSSMPKNLRDAEFYHLVFDADMGLCKISVVTKDIAEDPYGTEGKARFDELSTLLSEKYKKTSGTQIVGLKLWDQQDEFYQCLAYPGCGMWASVFESETKVVALELLGLTRGRGYLRLTVEAKPEWEEALKKYNALLAESEKDAL
ncbi:hypothetical protein [Deferrisoma palaeochoriense]